MSSTPGFLATFVRIVLVLSLAAAVWSVYRQLPDDDGRFFFGSGERKPATLRVVLRRSTINFPVASGKVPIQLYPINMVAARNEWESERRPGVRFDDFANRLMGHRQPVKAELDEQGEASVVVPRGRWWVHATVNGEQELTWRLPVNVNGREVQVDLTYDNAYLRTKAF